jgi:hypothetical protein
MGLLVVGTPLDWDASEPHRAKVKHDGITQFLALYDRLKDRKADVLYWGDEVGLPPPSAQLSRAGRQVSDGARAADSECTPVP